MIEEIRIRGISDLDPVALAEGARADAVVDPRPRGAEASIMPQVPAGNTSVPSIMIGEKCARNGPRGHSWRPSDAPPKRQVRDLRP
jgi:hypothetical protein